MAKWIFFSFTFHYIFFLCDTKFFCCVHFILHVHAMRTFSLPLVILSFLFSFAQFFLSLSQIFKLVYLKLLVICFGFSCFSCMCFSWVKLFFNFDVNIKVRERQSVRENFVTLQEKKKENFLLRKLKNAFQEIAVPNRH